MGGEEGIRALALGLLGVPSALDLLCFLKGIPTYLE